MSDTPTRRERVRAATLEEIKAAALDLMRESSPADVGFSDIARALGMTAPALYRYYRDRDDLLTALIADAYRDLADTLAACHSTSLSPRRGLAAVLEAYRGWAAADPTRFGLVFGSPISGYATPAGAGTIVSARRAMTALEGTATDRDGDPLVTQVGRELRRSLPAARTLPDAALSPASHQAVMLVWAAVHGFTSLEAFGHLAWLPQAARDDLFRAQVDLAVRTLGLEA